MKRAILCLLVGYLLLNPRSTSADTVALPHSYATLSDDRKLVFVMIAPVDFERDGIYLSEEDKQQAQLMRKKYAVSGLYRNDGSTTPLWAVDWYSPKVYVPSDGIHLVREGPWASSGDDEAVSFFANGRELKSYKVNDLVDFIWSLPHTVSHFTWEGSMQIDDPNKTLIITTLHKDKHAFDLTTGNITSSLMPIRYLVIVGLVSSLLLILLMTRKRRHAKENAV